MQIHPVEDELFRVRKLQKTPSLDSTYGSLRYGCSLTGIAGSNPAGGIDVYVVCC
jgi:hypothetical protein